MSLPISETNLTSEVDLAERRRTFTIFSRGMLIFAAHALVILGLLGLFTLR